MSNYQPKKKYLSQLRHTAHNEDAVQSHQHSQYQQHVNLMSKQDGSLLMNQQVSYPLPPMNGLSNSPDTSQLHRNDSFKPRTCFSETRPPEDAPMMMSPADPNGFVRMQNSYQVDMYMQNSHNFVMGVNHSLSEYDPKKSRHHMEKMDSFMWSHNRNIPMQPDQCNSSYNHMFPSLEVAHMNSSALSPMSPNVTGDGINMSHDVISPRSISTSDEMSVLHIKEEISGTGVGEGEDDQSSRIMSGQMMSPQLMTRQMPSNNMSPNLSKSFYHQDGNATRFSANDREAGVSSSLSSNSALHRPLLTSSGRNKGSGKPLEPKHACQVCGDVAAGFHCGAYVCEACKKFFLRCLKTGRGVMFLCPKNSKCDITKETRSHCQRCRYQRCMELGMYKPGREDDKKLKVDFRSIPCKVCKAPSSGFHFGAITCEGCKGFFRRMLKEQVHRKFVCSNDERCNIDSANRTTCKSCRFTKCINIGMTLEGTRLGRQSNSVKRGVIIQCLPNRHHLLNQRSLSLDTGASDSSPPTKSPTSHLNFDPTHPSTLRRLLSDAEAGKRRQVMGDDDDDDDDDSGDDEIPNLQPYGSDDVFLRSSDSSSANVMTSSSNRCMTQQYGNNDHPSTPSQRLNFSGGAELGSFHDLQPPMQYSRGDDSNQPDVEMISAHMMDGNNKNLMLAQSNSYLPLKSEPMEMTEGDGFIKTDVNFNPLLVPSDLSGQLRLERFGTGQSYPVDGIPPNIIHSNPRSAATHVHSHLGRELVNEFDALGGRAGMPPRLQLDNGRHLYSQPKLLFCNLVSAFKQLDDIWIRPAELEELMYCPATLNTIWKLVEIPFRHMVRVGVRFFKRVPGFTELSYMDRLRMCKDAIYPLWLVYHSNSFNMDTQDFSWFTATSKERDLILAYIHPLHSLVGHFRSVGFSLRSLHLNDVEISFLAAMAVLSSSDGSCLECPDAVFSLQDELLDAFFNYQQEFISYNKDGSETEADSSSSSTTRTSTRLAVMLARLAELKRANIEHCNVANQIIRSYPSIETGALWKEVFLGEALPLHPDSLTSDINSTDAHPSTS